MPLNILVTGAGGIIGRRLLPLLQAIGHKVISTGRHLPQDLPSVATINGDLLDAAVRARAFALLRDCGEHESAIIHLAAESNVAIASAGHGAVFNTNVLLTRLMLETAATENISRFLFASTGYVYGKSGIAPIPEDQVPRPQWIYSATKLAAEALVQGYSTECGITGTILRMSNVYGPDSPDSTVVGHILSQLQKRKTVNLASRTPVRDFIFIDDVTECICALLELPATAVEDIFNISTGIGTSAGALADIATAMTSGATFRAESLDPNNKDCLILSNERVRERTGWAPRHSIADGLRLCLATY